MSRRPCDQQQVPTEDWTRCDGAYVLLIRLGDPLELPQKQFEHPLSPGLYAYCGSARGPGGLGARIKRHLRADKKLHWHVDYLTTAGKIMDVAVVNGGSECDLCRSMVRLEGADVPLAGFGSSDCRTCDAHLIHVPQSFSFQQIGLPSVMDQLERHGAQ